MKDKEMAEEYRKSLKQRLIDEDDFERLEMFDENVEEAFLAGLKVGRPQWHDLRKNPNDLPKLDKTDLSDYVMTDRGVSYYNGRLNKWYIQTDYVLTDCVIAWCEIPTFDKE